MEKYEQFHGYQLLDKDLRSFFPDYSHKGTMVEIGAFDPILLSNTYHFEKNGWDTYHIEANPDQIDMFKIRKNGCLNYAVSDYDKDDVDFNIVTSCGAYPDMPLGGWTASYSSLDLKYSDHTNNPKKIVKTNVRTLNTIFDNEWKHLKDRYIDIMTIDVEGNELEVLKGVDFTKIKTANIMC